MNGSNATIPEVAGDYSAIKTATTTISLSEKLETTRTTKSTATKSETSSETAPAASTSISPPKIAPVEESPAARISVAVWFAVSSLALYAVLG